MEDVYLSIVIPVYNEEKRLPKNLDNIISFLKKRRESYEIILVDDGSTDRTWEIIQKYIRKYLNIVRLKHFTNRGKGAAVKTGMLASNGRIILMTDCDLSTPIEEMDNLIRYSSKYDIVIGSRRLKEKKIGRLPERYRIILGDIYYELLRLILLPSIKDTNCGFKLFNRRVVKPVFGRQLINRWGYDAEVLFIANKLGYSIKETPVKWTHYVDSKVRVFDAITKTLGELLQVKINQLRGRYD